MGELPVVGATYEVRCPHCGKAFAAELLNGGGNRQGFKCPHCKLFVAYERVAAEGRLAETGGR